jgi:site-specific DNA-methyltransferase (adenine-specific)
MAIYTRKAILAFYTRKAIWQGIPSPHLSSVVGTPMQEFTLYPGDCRESMRGIEPASIAACITDPPFHLKSITARFGAANAAPAQHGKDGAANRLSRGFMGQVWDGGDIAFRPELWAQVHSLLIPGGRVLAFGGTRTWHRMCCAIEDAGFEIEDTILWIFGQGLVLRKSRLKPGWSPIVTARKKGPVRDLDINACRTVEGRWPANIVHDGSPEVVALFPDAPGQQAVVSETAPSAKTSAVYGKLNREGGTNSIGERRHDTGSAARFFNACESDDINLVYHPKVTARDRVYRCVWCGGRCMSGERKTHRHGFDSFDHLDTHATAKPISLMRHLVRLVTRPGELVLDPFAGGGATGEAALLEKRRIIMCEGEPLHVDDIRYRMEKLST